ncbi:DUF421 domain-containing protein [Mangrovibacillus sp. Mu-81]|jgi:uncharacterized membrane protein YcaP (DUF421 family)|uniref:DUF421 domain-containing protein n=1 Tax=Mangrovibacillus sp. Mu-81 TaxID=3121478 RepID=UPI002FE4991F
MTILELSFRLVLAFLTLLILARVMGRKEISQMTFFNFVSAISLGTLGASLAVDSTLSVRNGMIALGAWTLFTLGTGLLDLKSKGIRKAVEGSPKVVIREGNILEGELRKLRLDVDALNELLRKKNVFSIKDVDYAIFETDGTLSVLKKEAAQPLTKADRMNAAPALKHYPIPIPIIEDGRYNEKHLKDYNISKEWVDQQLSKQGLHSSSNVFYAELQTDGTLFIDWVDGPQDESPRVH